MKKIAPWILAAAVSACGGAADVNDPTSDAMDIEAPQSVQLMKGASKPATTSSLLIDHGGKVLPASVTYAIWWSTSMSNFPSDAQTGLDNFFQGVSGTTFLGIAQQYMRGASISSSFAGNLYDTSGNGPTTSPKTSTIASEACNAITAAGLAPNPNAIYFVFAANMPGHTNYCAWHSYGTCNGTTIQIAYMPNTTGVAGCDPGNTYGCNSYSQGTRSLANVTSHEFMEAITDADPSSSTYGWIDSGGAEIGDKCAWQFASCVSLKSGKWQLQEEWSNSAGGCVQQ